MYNKSHFVLSRIYRNTLLNTVLKLKKNWTPFVTRFWIYWANIWLKMHWKRSMQKPRKVKKTMTNHNKLNLLSSIWKWKEITTGELSSAVLKTMFYDNRCRVPCVPCQHLFAFSVLYTFGSSFCWSIKTDLPTPWFCF